jgi:hypothetical protein
LKIDILFRLSNDKLIVWVSSSIIFALLRLDLLLDRHSLKGLHHFGMLLLHALVINEKGVPIAFEGLLFLLHLLEQIGRAHV